MAGENYALIAFVRVPCQSYEGARGEGSGFRSLRPAAHTSGRLEWAPETILRCEASRDVWDVISPEVRSEFNRRLKAEGKPAGRWGADETSVQRLFGKELLVLLWAVELPDVKPEEIAVAIRNWMGLKSEERWWLYTMTAAATGLAHQSGMGWRGALRQALCFGTRADTFHLSTITGRGTLVPRTNEDFAPNGAKPARKRKKSQPDDPGFLFASPLPAE